VLELAQRALEIDPAFTNAHRHVLDATWVMGDLEAFEKADAAAEAYLGVLGINRKSVEYHIAHGDMAAARAELDEQVVQVRSGEFSAAWAAMTAVSLEDFDTAGNMLLQAYEEKDGTWTFPLQVRLPEQAPDSKPWQEFWSKPGPARLAELRRKNGFNPKVPTFGSAAGQTP
jgi:hypothetical protein